MILYDALQLGDVLLGLHEGQFDHVHVAVPVEVTVLVEDIGDTCGHSGGEVPTAPAEHDDTTSGHVLTAMVSGTLRYGHGTAVPHTEPLTDGTRGVELSGCRTVHQGVTGDDVAAGNIPVMGEDDPSAGETLSNVVVGESLHPEGHTLGEERTEALSGGTDERYVQSVILQVGTPADDLSGQHHTHGTVDVGEPVDLLGPPARPDSLAAVLQDPPVEHTGEDVGLTGSDPPVTVEGHEHGREVHVGRLALCGLHLQQVRTADDLVQGPESHAGQGGPDVLGHEPPVPDDLIGVGPELGPPLGVLCGDTDGTCVGVALAAHHASHGDHGRCGEPELLCTQQGGDDHVPGGLHLTVHLQTNASAETVDHESLLDLGQSGLPGGSGVPYGGQGTGSGTTVSGRYQYHVGTGLRDTCRDGSHTGLGDQLHTDACGGVDALEVEDQLLQILDGIDVVVWRR